MKVNYAVNLYYFLRSSLSMGETIVGMHGSYVPFKVSYIDILSLYIEHRRLRRKSLKITSCARSGSCAPKMSSTMLIAIAQDGFKNKQ